MGMKFKVLVEYEYPTEHKLPVKAELVLHGDRVVTDNIKWIEQEPTTKNDLALLEKTYADFCSCEGGEGWLKIDGKEYGTDVGYAIEGVDIFMEVFKRRLAELPSVTPQEPFINKPCVSEKACEHDKNVVLDKIRAEISTVYESLDGYDPDSLGIFESKIDEILNKYKTESESDA